jgi:hypothetical protein
MRRLRYAWFLARTIASGNFRSLKRQKAFWGGYSGYVKDLDGHLWEVAHNPLFCVGPADENA